MNIHNLMVRQGEFLFRWRSFIPLLLLFPAIAAMSHSEMIENVFGDQVDDVVVFASYIIALCGLAVRWYTVGTVPAGTSGRNTKGQRADTLNTTGMYSIVKNPLYLGNFIAIMGILLAFKVWWFVLLGLMAYWIYIERIIATEEKYLLDKFGEEYTEWAGRTPIFLPSFKLWEKPAQAFRIKKVLRSEYYGLLAVSATFLINELISDLVFEGEVFAAWVRDDWMWIAQFFVAASAFLTLRYLKKNTNVLNTLPDNG